MSKNTKQDTKQDTKQNTKQTARHTPGPWKIKNRNYTANILAANGLEILATVNWNDWDEGNAGLANTKLIAAAPELLYACKAALEVCTDDVIQGLLNAAIARAEGSDDNKA